MASVASAVKVVIAVYATVAIVTVFIQSDIAAVSQIIPFFSSCHGKNFEKIQNWAFSVYSESNESSGSYRDVLEVDQPIGST